MVGSGSRHYAKFIAAVSIAALGGCLSSEPTAPSAGASPAPSQTNSAVDELLELTRERLLLMHEVAKWKWNRRAPIADPQREKDLLADLEKRGLAYGLRREQTREFMVAQIEAGKLVQTADFAKWERSGIGNFSDARDLDGDLRPKIGELSERMLTQLATLVKANDEKTSHLDIEQHARIVLSGEGIDDDVRRAALRPLTKL